MGVKNFDTPLKREDLTEVLCVSCALQPDISCQIFNMF